MSLSNKDRHPKPPQENRYEIDFLGVGAHRAATTWLYTHLNEHPQISCLLNKEICFFNQDSCHYSPLISQQKISSYEKILKKGIISPAYACIERSLIQEIYTNYPSLKIFYSLRNPIDRAWSAARAALERCEMQPQEASDQWFIDVFRSQASLQQSNYIACIGNWVSVFPESQMHLILFDDIVLDPRQVLCRLLNHLELDFSPFEAVNEVQLEEPIFKGVNFSIRSTLSAVLHEIYEPQIDKLADFLGRDLSSWKLDRSYSQPLHPRKSEDGSRLTSAATPNLYEKGWDLYAESWKQTPELTYIGDEWVGKGAGAASSLEEYNCLIRKHLIEPYIKSTDTVLEIGVGGGKTANLILEYCDRLICADISQAMLSAAHRRLGQERVSYVKLDGYSLSGIAEQSVDACFSYDTFVHLEPRDIFNYLTLIPRVMRGNRICIFHHATILSELGWQKFLSEWQGNLLGRKQGTAFSVMTESIMEKFLKHLGYTVLATDTQLAPRDCIWICKAPEL